MPDTTNPNDAVLVAAVAAKDAKAAKAALAAGASANAVTAKKRPVLLEALEVKSKTLSKLLLDAGADVNGADTKQVTPLHVICTTFPDLDLAAALLKAGANPNVLASDDQSPLHHAILRPKLDLAGLLLDHGADINIHDGHRGETPLQLTIRTNTKTSRIAMEWLLNRGADANALNDNTDNAVATAIYHADNDLSLIEMLLKFGGKPATNEHGDTPLHRAVDCNHNRGAVWAFAFDHNPADINAQCSNKRTPLHAAISRGNVPAIKFLVANGADLSLRCNKGKSALDEAKNMRQGEAVVALLEAAGAV